MRKVNHEDVRAWPVVAVMTVFLFACTPLMAGAQPVTFEQGNGRLDIHVAGKPVAAYVWQDPQVPRPYFAHVNAPNGMQVTRNHPPDPGADAGNDDHPTFHPGVWLAFGDLNGADFWRNKARVRHAEFAAEPVGGDGVGQFEVVNVYETPDAASEAIAQERARYVFRVTDHGYLLTCDYVFTPLDGDLVFGDQEEMGFGVRLATPLTVKHGNGRILNSAGGRDEKETWGKKARWCAGWGAVDETCVGAVLMPAPGNFRTSWFHSRDYGLIAANPFGKKAMTGPKDPSVPLDRTVVEHGTTFQLGFAVGLFSVKGDPVPAVEALHAAYLNSR